MTAVIIAVVIALIMIVIAFLVYLHMRTKQDREQSEACHEFQRQLNTQTLVAFSAVTEALNANTKALTDFLKREGGSVRT